MNENLGINMDSYLEWNILLTVLALFGNFPYGPPLSPNGISDSFVSLSVSLTHRQHEVVYTAGNFLCSGCVGECICGNWGLGLNLTAGDTQRLPQRALVTKTHYKKKKEKKKRTSTWTHIIYLGCVLDGWCWYDTHMLLHSGNMRIFMSYML